MTPLDEGQIWVMRIHATAFALLLLAAGAGAALVLHSTFAVPPGAVVAPLLAVAIWLVFLAPRRRFAAWGYRMDEHELEVRRGVWTEVHTVVPLDRVQHIDVAQGPVERSFGVARLILHTAGTLHAQVLLPGVRRATAEAMRDEIRARIRQEAG